MIILEIIAVLLLLIVCVSNYWNMKHYNKTQRLIIQQGKTAQILLDKVEEVSNDTKALVATLGYIKNKVRPNIIEKTKEKENVRVVRDGITGAEFEEELNNAIKPK